MSHPLLDQLSEKVFSVSEYLELVNSIMSPLAVEVVGEVSDLKVLPQWTFFALKDAEDGSLLRCGMHSAVYRRVGVLLEDGMRVKVYGYGKIAAKSGNFGFWVSKVEPVGEGALRRSYELLLKRLSDEGLFARKRDLPSFISHIGVISSRNGVVLQDLRNNLRKLGIRIDFLHSGVEGQDSARELVSAIEHFSHTVEVPQVLVLIRGGGSLESLQGFNNELVCRALFAAPMPVLVGIGHDVDAPIATLVADWSASTPTAVAHVINESWSPLTDRVPLLAVRVHGRFTARLQTAAQSVPFTVHRVSAHMRQRLRAVSHRIEIISRIAEHAVAQVVGRFRSYEEVLSYARKRIPVRLRDIEREGSSQLRSTFGALRTRVIAFDRGLTEYGRLLIARDPEKVLARGYALVHGPDGKLVRDVEQVSVGAILKTQLHKGTIQSTVIAKEYL
ncbi:MAG: exodeoxyribonuclease VII large subunit [Candidatus Pacebacteria bacterium]|nr:exodeoxyribonuclease VII large subunit [Candidatus Paceibacterota bacterium]